MRRRMRCGNALHGAGADPATRCRASSVGSRNHGSRNCGSRNCDSRNCDSQNYGSQNCGSPQLRDGGSEIGTRTADQELADLRRQVETLREALRARDDFIAIAAHELRNPMTPIMAVAELALQAAREAEDTCPARITVLLERMQLFVKDFVQRSTRLLEVPRIEAGTPPPTSAPTDLSALVRTVADRYAAVAARFCSPIRCDIEDGLHGVLARVAVEQAIENLLSNAIKFGAGKPLSIRLRSDGARARVEVEDHGAGMSAERQAGLFGPFAPIVAWTHGGGLGIGLWRTNRLVSSMGGDIAVASREGAGSCFTVTLPLVPPQAHGSSQAHVSFKAGPLQAQGPVQAQGPPPARRADHDVA